MEQLISTLMNHLCNTTFFFLSIYNMIYHNTIIPFFLFFFNIILFGTNNCTKKRHEYNTRSVKKKRGKKGGIYKINRKNLRDNAQ